MCRVSVVVLMAVVGCAACSGSRFDDRAVYEAALRALTSDGSGAAIAVDERLLLTTDGGIPYPGDHAEHFGATSDAIVHGAVAAGVPVCDRAAGACTVSGDSRYMALTKAVGTDSDTATIGAIVAERSIEGVTIHYYKVLVFREGERLGSRVEWVGVDN